MTKKQINQKIIDAGYEDEGILLADGFEDAFVGLSVFQPARPVCAVYDYDKCIDILNKRDKMSIEEAVEYFDFNVSGAWVGEQTPIFINKNFI